MHEAFEPLNRLRLKAELLEWLFEPYKVRAFDLWEPSDGKGSFLDYAMAQKQKAPDESGA